jgi:hypothetical protein
MEIISGLLSGLSLTVIVVVSVVLFINADKLKKETENTMKDVVDQINDSQYYAYKFDKKQEQNIMNLDNNIQNVNKKTDDLNTILAAKEQQLKQEIGNVQRDAVKQNQMVEGVPYVKTGKVQLGDKFLLSGVGDAHGNDDWLRVFNKEGKDYRGGVAMKNLWTGENAWLNGTVNLNNTTNSHGNLNIRGGSSEHNPEGWWTHFPWEGDNKNYIRGDTELRGNTNNIGDMNIGRNLNVQGRMHFKDPKMDANANWESNGSDSYFLEKVVTKPNESSLRLTMNDDNDESFQIWGGSCDTGNCKTGNEKLKHKFDALGNATHAGDITSVGATFYDASIDSAQGQGLMNLVAGAKHDKSTNQFRTITNRGSSRIRLHDDSITLYTSPSSGTTGAPVSYTDRLTITNDGTTTINGNTNNMGNFNIQGRLHFKDPKMDANGNWEGNGSDSYFMEKVVSTPNQSSLRLTMNDDADESFQIWGGSCANGNCSTGNESMRHSFDAVGNATHTGDINASRICTGNVCLRGEGTALIMESRDRTKNIARFSPDWDKIVLSMNSDGRAPYFYVNQGKGYGVIG